MRCHEQRQACVEATGLASRVRTQCSPPYEQCGRSWGKTGEDQSRPATLGRRDAEDVKVEQGREKEGRGLVQIEKLASAKASAAVRWSRHRQSR